MFSLCHPLGPEQVRQLLQMTLSAVRLGEMINWERIVEQLSGASAATVVKAAQDAAKAAVLRGKKSVAESDLQEAVANFGVGILRRESLKGCQISTTSSISRCCFVTKEEPVSEALAPLRHKHEQTGMHDRRTANALSTAATSLSTSWKERKAQRQEQNLPVIKEGIPILIQVDPSLDLDALRDKFAFEIVAEQEEGYCNCCI